MRSVVKILQKCGQYKKIPFSLLMGWIGKLWMFMVVLALVSYSLIVVTNKTRYKEVNSLTSSSELPILIDAKWFSESLTTESTVIHSEETHLQPCPPLPLDLKGRLQVLENVTMREAEAEAVKGGIKKGGFWSPYYCLPRWRVAIIVPYRDRASQMGSFLHHMHSFLQRQQLNYSIYIVEQEGNDLFNRARLLNIGYLEAQKEGPWDCYAFHDIDMLPEDDRHLYHCSDQPRHLAVATSNHKYKLVYEKYFGGACLMTPKQIEAVNGWSNIYWGWGGEDDDMWRRIRFEDMTVWRYPKHLARYWTINHPPQVLNEERYKTLARNNGRYPSDGLNSLKYELRNITREILYTHILANIGSSRDLTKFFQKNRDKRWKIFGKNR